jgi:SAM-dependent methyltransferase
MDWFEDLYDDFRMATGFGQVSDEQTKREVDFICDVLELPEGAQVLDLFCGAGRHSLELARRGYVATGIEFNQHYLELAKQLSEGEKGATNFIQGDVRRVDFGVGYDAAVIMFNSFGYFSDEEDRLVLAKIFNALKEGGRFLLEVLNKDWIIKNFKESDESEIGGIRVVEKRRFDLLTSRNNFIIERYERDGVITKQGSWRLYSAHELNNILEGIGFRFIAGYSNLEKEPLMKDTRLMRMVFEKLIGPRRIFLDD